jgi:hypothetical protein
MRAAEHPEVVAAANGNGNHDHRKLLIALAVGTAAIVVLVVFVRSFTTQQADQSLCEKLDRLTVKIEAAVKANPDLTEAQRKQQIMFWEDFRNDPPVCRTPGP